MCELCNVSASKIYFKKLNLVRRVIVYKCKLHFAIEGYVRYLNACRILWCILAAICLLFVFHCTTKIMVHTGYLTDNDAQAPRLCHCLIIIIHGTLS